MMAVVETIWPYALVGLAAFIGGSLVPISSEAALLAQIKSGYGAPWWLVIAATVGNTAGAIFNWGLGRCIDQFKDRRWFPFTADKMARAQAYFGRWGRLALPFTWVPFIGDVLTLVAGTFRVPLWQFIPLVAIGRFARYAVLVWGLAKLGWV